MKLLALVIVGLFTGLYHVWGRNQRYADALRAECLLCEGEEVDERDDGYACRACGFDTDWQNDPEKADTLELFRALTHARDDLRLGVEVLKGGGRADDVQALAGNYELSAQAYLKRAGELDPDLFQDLQDEKLSVQLERVSELRESVRMLLSA